MRNLFFKLERSRKFIASLWCVWSLGLFAVVSVSIGGYLWRGIAAAALAIHFALAGVYWKNGIAKAAKWLTYYLLAVAAIPAALMFPQYHSVRWIACLIYGILTEALHLPHKIEDWVFGKLHTVPPKAKAEDLLLPVKSRKNVDYDVMAEYKELSRYMAKPYAISNFPGPLMWLRIIFGAAGILIGIAALVLWGHPEEPLGNPFASQTFWGAALGICALFGGMAVFYFGFLRALLVPAAETGLLALGFLCYFAIDRSRSVSMAYAAVLASCMLILAVGGIYLIVKKLSHSGDSSFAIFEIDRHVRGADLTLKDLLPIQGYDALCVCRVPLGTFESIGDLRRVDRLHRELLRFAGRRRLIFCGYDVDIDDAADLLYLYTNSAHSAEPQLARFLRSQGYPKSVVACSEDPGWNGYLQTVYPGPYLLHEIFNRNLFENLESAGFDFIEEVPQVFQFLFSEKESALRLKEQAGQYGFTRAEFYDNTESALQYDLQEQYRYIVLAERTGKLGLDRMNLQTRQAIDLAACCSGEFDDWSIGEIDDSPETAAEVEQ